MLVPNKRVNAWRTKKLEHLRVNEKGGITKSEKEKIDNAAKKL